MKKKQTISLIIGIVVSAIALYLALRNVPFSGFIEYITTINYFWVIPSMLAGVVSFFVRVYRWQIILESSKKISFWSAFHPMMIGFTINCILPLRAGEFARPAILMKNSGVPYTAGLATVAAERLFDIIMIIFLFAITLSFVTIDPDLDTVFGDIHLNKEELESLFKGLILVCVALLAGIILVSIKSTRKRILWIIGLIPYLFFFCNIKVRDFIKNRVCPLLVRIIEEDITSGFALIKNPKQICICFVLSFFVWFLAIISYQLLAFGCPGIDLTLYEMAAVMIIVCLFIALPSVPGFWGLWEAGGVFALALFGIQSKEAFGFTLTNHVAQMIPCIIMGFVSAFIIGVNILQIDYNNKGVGAGS